MITSTRIITKTFYHYVRSTIWIKWCIMLLNLSFQQVHVHVIHSSCCSGPRRYTTPLHCCFEQGCSGQIVVPCVYYGFFWSFHPKILNDNKLGLSCLLISAPPKQLCLPSCTLNSFIFPPYLVRLSSGPFFDFSATIL